MATIVTNGNSGLLGNYRAVVSGAPGVPTPDTDEGYQFWEEEVHRNEERAFNLLHRMEELGHKWATRLIDELF